MFLSYVFQSTLVISKSVTFLSYVFQSILMNFMIYIKITILRLNTLRWKKTYLTTSVSLVTR